MSDELHTHKIIVDFAKGTNERIPLTAEEIAAFKKRDEEREAEKPQRQLAQIRELRNKLLAEIVVKYLHKSNLIFKTKDINKYIDEYCEVFQKSPIKELGSGFGFNEGLFLYCIINL